MGDHGRSAAARFQGGPLHLAPTGLPCLVRRVLASEQAPERKQQLEDIGFEPGEPVMVVTRGVPGGDPLAVRIGTSTFALRIAEAACIEVEAQPL